MPLLVLADVRIAGTCDCCSRSNNGNCGNENCIGCIIEDTSSVLLHGISQAKSLVLGAGAEVVCLHLKESCSSSSCFKHHAYYCKDLLIYMLATCSVYFQEGVEMVPYF